MRRLAFVALALAMAAAAACAGLGIDDDLDAVPLPPVVAPLHDAAVADAPPGAEPLDGAAAAPDAADGSVVADAAPPFVFTVEVGLGSTEFDPIGADAAADIITGPQGGYHVWTAVRVDDPQLEQAQLTLSATYEATGEGAGAALASFVVFVPDGDAAVAYGLRTILADPTRARGQRIRIQADIVAPDGDAATDTRTVTAR